MASVNNPNVSAFDGYTKSDWVNFLEQGAYRGLRINKVAKRLEKSQSCTYDKLAHTLELVDKRGKTIILDMNQLSRKNDHWSLSRLIHNVKLWFPNSEYAKNFHTRMDVLAEVFIQKTTAEIQLELHELIDDFDNQKFSDIRNFFNQNVKQIDKSTGNHEIRTDLLKLCKKIGGTSPFTREGVLVGEIQATVNKASTKNTADEFLKELKQLNKQKFDSDEIAYLEKFFNKNLNLINAATGNTDIRDELLALSSMIRDNFDDAKARALSFQIQCTAIAMIPDPKAAWDVLPPEIQSNIFSNLVLGSLISQPISKNFNKNISELTDQKVKDDFISLKTLGCTDAKQAVKYVIDHKLNSANFSGFDDFTDADLEELTSNCPYLKKLAIHSRHITGDKLAEGLEKVPNLQKLDLYFCRQISGDKIAEAIGRLTKLEHLNLGCCSKIPKDKLIGALQKLTGLQNLSLEGCFNVMSDDLAEALGNLTGLKNLSIDYNGRVFMDKLIEVLEKLPNLERLGGFACNLSDMEVFAQKFPDLDVSIW